MSTTSRQDLQQQHAMSNALTASMLRQHSLMEDLFAQQQTSLLELSRALNETSSFGIAGLPTWMVPSFCQSRPTLCLAIAALAATQDRQGVVTLCEWLLHLE